MKSNLFIPSLTPLWPKSVILELWPILTQAKPPPQRGFCTIPDTQDHWEMLMMGTQWRISWLKSEKGALLSNQQPWLLTGKGIESIWLIRQVRCSFTIAKKLGPSGCFWVLFFKLWSNPLNLILRVQPYLIHYVHITVGRISSFSSSRPETVLSKQQVSSAPCPHHAVPYVCKGSWCLL